MVKVTNKDLIKVMNKINELMGEKYIKNIDEFTLSEKQFISYNMMLFNNNVDKVIEALF